MTSADVGTMRSRAAARRRATYEARLAAAKGSRFRSRLWVLIGWLCSEEKKFDAAGREWLLNEVAGVAREANGRNAG